MTDNDVGCFFIYRRVRYFVVLNVDRRRFTARQQEYALAGEFGRPGRALAWASFAVVRVVGQQREEGGDRVFHVIRGFKGVLFHGVESLRRSFIVLRLVHAHLRLLRGGNGVQVIVVRFFTTTPDGKCGRTGDRRRCGYFFRFLRKLVHRTGSTGRVGVDQPFHTCHD